MSNMLGYLIWWTAPKVESPCRELDTLAASPRVRRRLLYAA